MNKPRLLDLFCGAGGCSVGYSRAGFDCYGIDNDPKPLRHYPFPFICMDALEAMDRLLRGEGLTFSNGETLYLRDFAAFHASPPCQGVSIMRNLPWLKDRHYEVLIAPVRKLLEATGKPYVIENVAAAKYGSKHLEKLGLSEHGMQAGWLCGGMFGLPIYFHRLFETNFAWLAPGHPKHTKFIRQGHQLRERCRVPVWNNGFRCMDDVGSMVLDGHPSKKDVLRVGLAKGIDWMDGEGLSQAIPPVYLEYIGKFLLQQVKEGAACIN